MLLPVTQFFIHFQDLLMNIYLIGYRCTGKTSVGMALARTLSMPFVDTDEVIVEKAGKSVADIVAESGWDHFRSLEEQAVKEIASLSGHIVAPGGGAVLFAANQEAMKKSGRIVWLVASVEAIKDRMEKDPATLGNRPSLTSQGLYEEIESVLKQRTPLYNDAADITLDTETKNVEEICLEIKKSFFPDSH